MCVVLGGSPARQMSPIYCSRSGLSVATAELRRLHAVATVKLLGTDENNHCGGGMQW